MTYLEENLALLSSNDTRARIRSARSGGYTAVKTEYGVTLSKDGVQITSKTNPRAEGERIAERCLDNAPSPDVIVCLGAGGLSHIETFLLREPRAKIIVIEKSPELLHALLSEDAFPSLLRVTLLCGRSPAECKRALRTLIGDTESDRAIVARHPGEYRLEREYYTEVEIAFKEVLKEKLASLASYCYFAPLWTRNILRNATRTHTFSAKNLHGALEGTIDALIIAGGPSIDRHANAIAEVSASSFVIALANPLAALRAFNVRPDIVVTADGGFYAASHLLGTDDASIPVVSALSAYAPPLARFSKTPFFSYGSFIETTAFPSLPVFPMEGAAIVTALRIARLLSPKTAFLAGCDFGYPFTGGKTHSAFSNSYAIDALRADKTRTLESLSYARAHPTAETPAYNGTRIATNAALEAYREAAENAIDEFEFPAQTITPESARLHNVSLAKTKRSAARPRKAISFERVTADIPAVKRELEAARALAKKEDVAALVVNDIAKELAPFYVMRAKRTRTNDAQKALIEYLLKELPAFIAIAGG